MLLIVPPGTQDCLSCWDRRETGYRSSPPVTAPTDRPISPCSSTYEPSLIVVAQGRKQVDLGATTFVYDESRYLATSIDLPIVTRVVQASEAEPCLALMLKLEKPLVRELLAEPALLHSSRTRPPALPWERACVRSESPYGKSYQLTAQQLGSCGTGRRPGGGGRNGCLHPAPPLRNPDVNESSAIPEVVTPANGEGKSGYIRYRKFTQAHRLARRCASYQRHTG